MRSDVYVRCLVHHFLEYETSRPNYVSQKDKDQVMSSKLYPSKTSFQGM